MANKTATKELNGKQLNFILQTLSQLQYLGKESGIMLRNTDYDEPLYRFADTMSKISAFIDNIDKKMLKEITSLVVKADSGE